MSALCQKRTHAVQQTNIAILDHLVGEGEQRLRHCQTERLGGFEIDRQLVFGWRLYRQVGRLLTFKDPIGITGRAPE